MASYILAYIRSSSGLLPDRCQAINWTNADLSSIDFSEFSVESHFFIEENMFWNMMCWLVAILFKPQCVKKFTQA